MSSTQSNNIQDKKIVLVGKKYNGEKSHGPTAIMYSLEKAFSHLGITFDSIYLDENCGKFKYFWKLWGILFYREKIINVHVNGFLTATIVCFISKINKSCDYYLTVHGIYKEQTKYYNAGWSQKIYCALEKYVYNFFPNLICVSDLCKNKVLEFYHPKGNIFVVENAIDVKNIEVLDKKTIRKEFLFLGGTKPVKGIDQLIDVFDKLINLDRDIHLNIYGRTSPEELDLLTSKVKSMGKSDSIRYRGCIDNKEELMEIIGNNDFHIALSKFDTFNMAIVEAMYYGCINLTNMYSGAASLIKNGTNGYLISENLDNLSVATLIQNIVSSLSIDDYNMIRKTAHDNIKNYTWNNVAIKYLELFEGGKDESISH